MQISSVNKVHALKSKCLSLNYKPGPFTDAKKSTMYSSILPAFSLAIKITGKMAGDESSEPTSERSSQPAREPPACKSVSLPAS